MQTQDNQKLFDKGLAIRKQVLGSEYVTESLNNATDLNKPLQELVTKYCWGEVWGRDTLSLKMRSMINLAMMTALNRPNELRLHVNGALNNGLSQAEICEVLLQAGIYCGIPAAIDSFKVAQSIFEQRDSQN